MSSLLALLDFSLLIAGPVASTQYNEAAHSFGTKSVPDLVLNPLASEPLWPGSEPCAARNSPGCTRVGGGWPSNETMVVILR